MLSIKKFAAIDIGSNAVRLLISTVTEPDNKPVTFKKTSLVRVPIRLGQDVFTKSYISDESTERMIDVMKAFSLLMKSHRIHAYRACATSAMRDAKNGKAVAEKIASECKIDIEIIDGSDEASIIAATDLHTLVDDNKTYLYVDVGGGSTEFTLFSEGKTIESKSFKLGTVRILNNTIAEDVWSEAEHWVKKVTRSYSRIEMVGSGGNINNIFKSSNKKLGKPLSYFYLSSYYQLLNSLTFEERISELSLNEDRADVIIPATKIYLSAMKWSKSKSVHVPKIGLVDGIVKSLYQNSKLVKA
ncbi:exopolyphosphatase [Psychroflexus sp. CAK8W]|uniref:Exopolyphosphatase n=1 Tax=Psychroflexus longus TaxID=2873596 RepID=A0ABS7XL92_9FLAO|nr:exopolyphosphatase [Psychroflexus longus]MBZ9779759.1 exopolyphosphatase [Psychroflexus longus]